MGLFGDIASGIGSFFSDGDNIAGLVGGGLSYLGARQSSQAAQQAGLANAEAIRQAAADQMAASQPWGVGSIGGTASFDPNSQTAMLGLSPQLQNMYQGLLDRAGLFGGQATTLSADPFGAGDYFYEQQQQYWDPKEAQMRTDAETRLLAQGRLGTTGGQRAMGELEESILSGQQQRRAQSFSQAQSLIDSLLGRESGDIGQAMGLLNIPLQQAQLGRGIGGNLSSAAAAGLGARQAAAGMQYQPQAISPMGTAATALGGLFLTPRKAVE